MQRPAAKPLVAIACGGTGGHLFPGLAVGEALQARGADVLLLISPKEVDQQAAGTARGMRVETLPAVASGRGRMKEFFRGCVASYRAAKRLFRGRPPQAVLAMGGFTSAPPVWAGRRLGAKTFLHESNTIPGKANRWLAHFVDEAYVYFPQTAARLWNPRIVEVGMPVRPQFAPMDPAPPRQALGLDALRPVLLVMGGSQGASGINDLVTRSLERLAAALPALQFIHLTGVNDTDKVRAAYAAAGRRAVVRPFLTEMELAMGAATVALSRAGASSLAETAAMRLPSILVPLPTAADDHQRHNALAFVRTGAARLLEQPGATPERLVELVGELIANEPARRAMQSALAQWHFPAAAGKVADRILLAIGVTEPVAGGAVVAPVTQAARRDRTDGSGFARAEFSARRDDVQTVLEPSA
jgi:UDP-N-acetylglucosamine--N-acetylmuramyl-(pentapeptide) pyrophosphoryl-undecaprenol N-acetylglucosamine transferase